MRTPGGLPAAPERNRSGDIPVLGQPRKKTTMTRWNIVTAMREETRRTSPRTRPHRSILQDRDRPHSARSVVRSTCIRIPPLFRAFETLLAECPGSSARILLHSCSNRDGQTSLLVPVLSQTERRTCMMIEPRKIVLSTIWLCQHNSSEYHHFVLY